MKPFGSYHGGDLDRISMSNGNLFFRADLLAYQQRASELPFRIFLQYNEESLSFVSQNCPAGVKVNQCPHFMVFGPPWKMNTVSLGNAVTIGIEEMPKIVPTGGPGPGVNTGLSFNGQPIYVQLYSILTSDGSLHPLANTNAGSLALDGSGFVVANGYLMDSHGTKFSSVAEDANGNQINFSTGTDTIGRQIPAMPGPAYSASTPPASTASLSACPALGYSNQAITYAYTWNLPTVNGGTLPLTLCYAPIYVNTNSPASDTEFFHGLHQTFTMLQSVVFPDNTYWAFQYEAGDPNNTSLVAYGDLLKITLPTGGSLSYTWAPCVCSTAFARSVMTRSVDANDGNAPQTWHYFYSSQGNVNNNPTQTTIVTDPLGNDAVHTMTGLGSFASLYETQVQYFQGSQNSGTLLKTVNTDYQYTLNVYDGGYISGGDGSVTNVFPIRVTTTLPNGLVSKTETDYENAVAYHGPLDGITSNVYNCDASGACQYQDQITEPVTNYTGSYGKVIATREYDWGQGTPGPLLHQTATNYLWQSNGNYRVYNFLDLVSSSTVKDGSGNQVSQTTYGYDEYALNPSGVSTQFNSSPINGSLRGNQTSVHRWLNGSTTATPSCPITIGNGFLVSYTQYNDTGTVYKVTDACGISAGDSNHTTTHSYDLAYAGAYSTKSCNPLNQCVGGTYDFNTGLLTSLADANGQTTNYFYDNRWRMTQALFPVADSSGIRPETDFSYPNVTTVQRKKKQDTNNWITDYAYFDGLGRTKQTRLIDPEGDDFVDTTYDALGRVSTVSNPHRNASSPTDGTTTTYYDALGRVVQIARADGTLVLAGTAVTQCQPNNLCTDYSNFPTITTTDQAGKIRRSRSDVLGRLVEVDEPGPGANGPGTPGAGSISISGSLYSSSTNGTAATGSVTVSGSVQKFYVWICNDTCIRQLKTDPGGTVSITVNGHANSVSYGGASTANSIASQLVSQINGDGAAFVWASGPTCADITDCTIILTARTNGPNYSISAQGQSNDETDGFNSFDSTSASGTTLTGGAYPSTTYDSGTMTVTVGNFQASAPYSQSQNSNATAMAQALTSALNTSGSPVNASVSGATISMTAKTVGTATNYTVTGSSARSFTASGTTLSGGTNPGGLAAPYVTNYSYDTLGNLVQVSQAGDGSQTARVRTFTYDSLSRLLTATNPETGKITYQYDANGNTLQKISPAPNQTSTATQTISYCYDVLSRPTGRVYSAQACPLTSPVVTYTYDTGTNGIGHLTSWTDQAGMGSYTYDPLGRIATEVRTLAGVSKSLSYSYNLDSSLNSLTYPSGAVIQYRYTTAGHPGAVQDTINNINYVTGTNGLPNLATHAPDGSLASYVNGSSTTFSGITSDISYNKRLQPVTMAATFGSPAQTVFSLTYDFNLGNGDNGNVWVITNNRDTSRNQTFNYDQLNRLISAQNAGTDCTRKTVNNLTEYWGNNYGYDPWGNLTQKTVTKCSAENLNAAASNTNQLHTTSGTDYAYDAAGNMTHDATTSANYTFDLENRITGANGYTYTYDDDGNRVAKSNSSTGTLYWYMSLGIVAESDLGGALKSEYVFFNGTRVARKDFPGNAISYYFSDRLKTASVVTDSVGNIKEDEDFYPWGGELQFVNSDSNHFKFGGHERDSETGLDYEGARHYANWTGRFITPDWATHPMAVPYADFGNPQTLNLYAFARNNPTTFGDPNGHCPWCLALAGGGTLEGAGGLVLASNPVGWAILGIAAVGTIGYVAYSHYHNSSNNSGSNNNSQPAATSSGQSTPAVPPPPPQPELGKHNNHKKGSSSKTKSYQTYTKANSQTGEVYSGRTSGTGTPEENVAARDASHHMNEQGFGSAEF